MNDENNEFANLTPEQIKVIIQERDELAKAKQSLTEDLLAEKKKKQEAEAKIKTLAPTTAPDDVQRIVEETLLKREQEDIKKAQEEAWEKFLANNKEFSPDVDKEGLRKTALESKLKNFNFNGARKVEDFMERLNDAAMLLNKVQSPSPSNPYASQPAHSGGAPVVSEGASLSPTERATMSRLGWDVKKFTDMKLKHPEMFASLFQQ